MNARLRTLQIETVTYCNGKCVFCPVKDMKRERGIIKDNLYNKIIVDCKDLKVPLEMVYPFLNGEPFLDPKLFDRVAFTHETLPKTRIGLFTNGSLMDESITEQIMKSGITDINISLNAISDEQRMKVMGLELSTTCGNIAYLKKRNDELGKNIWISVSVVSDTTLIQQEEKIAFLKFWEEVKIDPYLFNNGNWAGITRPLVWCSKTPCLRIFSDMTVLYDGRVNLCCYDLEGEEIFGDLNTQSVIEVWESEKFSQLRELHAKGQRNEHKLCGKCTTG